MPELAAIQQEFLALLQHNSRDLEQRVDSLGSLSVAQCVDIYRNAYRVRLGEAISNDHDILGLYLGDDLFDQMVDGFIDAFPSEYTSLRHFADRLPGFLLRRLLLASILLLPTWRILNAACLTPLTART